MNRSVLVAVIVFGVLLLDQVLKFWIKTNMCLNEAIPVFGDWFYLRFTENKGMAFGLELGGEYGKLALSVFRIIAVGLIGYYMLTLVNTKVSKSFLACIALIFAGAVGNIIDSAFYGLVFSESGNYYHSSHCNPAVFMPAGGGYEGFLHGSVVDMLHFQVLKGTYPSWVPFYGGSDFEFFRPIFNIADASISIGVVSLLLFHRGFFKKHTEAVENAELEVKSPELGVRNDE